MKNVCVERMSIRCENAERPVLLAPRGRPATLPHHRWSVNFVIRRFSFVCCANIRISVIVMLITCTRNARFRRSLASFSGSLFEKKKQFDSIRSVVAGPVADRCIRGNRIDFLRKSSGPAFLGSDHFYCRCVRDTTLCKCPDQMSTIGVARHPASSMAVQRWPCNLCSKVHVRNDTCIRGLQVCSPRHFSIWLTLCHISLHWSIAAATTMTQNAENETELTFSLPLSLLGIAIADGGLLWLAHFSLRAYEWHVCYYTFRCRRHCWRSFNVFWFYSCAVYRSPKLKNINTYTHVTKHLKFILCFDAKQGIDEK